MELKITEKVDSIGIGGDVLIDSNETIAYENGIDSVLDTAKDMRMDIHIVEK